MEYIEEYLHQQKESHITQTNMTPDEETVRFPVHISDFFNQLLNPGNEESQFFRELNTIVETMKTQFVSIPLFYREHYQRRKEEFIRLTVAMELAKISNEDLPLVMLCRSIISSNDDHFLVSLYGWNTLSSKLDNLLRKYFKDDSLKINLLANNDRLRQRYLNLECKYHIVYKKMEQLEQTLNNLKQRRQEPVDQTEYYSELCDSKDRVIDELKEDKLRLEAEKRAITRLSERQISITDVYLRQNKRLSLKLSQLSKKVETILLRDQGLSDENRLLRMELELLRKENKILVSSEESKRQKLERALDRTEKLDKERRQVVSENEGLRTQLSVVSSHLKSRTNELTQLKMSITKLKEKLPPSQASQIEKFTQAVTANETTLSLMFETLPKMIEDVNKGVQALDVSHLTPIKTSFF